MSVEYVSVVFMGHVLSNRGVGLAEVKVKAVVEVREPMTAAEVRSFLGLVNYSARFIQSNTFVPQDSYSIFKTCVMFFLITSMNSNIVHNIMDPFTTL
jgi:ABC-type uncharacterized transport system permease subunit